MGNSYQTIAFYQDKCDGCGDCVPACSKHHTGTTDSAHSRIKVAMDNYPTIAIFMCQSVQHELKRNRGKNKQVCKSILDVKDPSSLHCLAAVNYYQVGTETVVLWLSTTLEEPPVDSIHVTW